jgi:cytolysin (calcineurin-like family phosphatase)
MWLGVDFLVRKQSKQAVKASVECTITDSTIEANMSEVANVFSVQAYSETEIVFNSVEDMITFFDDITANKYVSVSYEKDGRMEGELVRPDVKALISDGRMKLRSSTPVIKKK